MSKKIKGEIIGTLTFILGLDNYKRVQIIYIVLNKLDATYNTIPAWLTNLSALSVPVLVYLTTKDISKVIITPLGMVAFYLLTIGALKLIVSDVIKNAGINGNFVLPGKYFIRHYDTAACHIDISDVDDGRYEFATEATAMESAIINCEAYDYSAWGTSLENKYERNLSHIQKNPYCILLFKCKNKKDYIGFSHCIPVGKTVWDDYISGRIRDNKFSADHVLPLKIDASKCYGVIMFSLGLRKPDKGLDIPTDSHELGDILEQASCYHFHLIKEMFKKGEKIPVVLQNFSIAYHRYFEDCAIFEGTTKEGGKIIKFYVANY